LTSPLESDIVNPSKGRKTQRWKKMENLIIIEADRLSKELKIDFRKILEILLANSTKKK
jgi:hypothetical protein